MTKQQKSEYNRRYYEAHRAEIRARQAEWYKDNFRSMYPAIAAYRDRNPEKFQAEQIVRQFLHRNKVKKGVCPVCSKKATDTHHPDYSKPYSVVFACRQCHVDIHYGRTACWPAADVREVYAHG